jgi:hypothetical protein
MIRPSAIALVSLLIGCAHGESAVRPGPPLHLRLAPPPGLAQLEILAQDRVSSVDYPGRDSAKVSEALRTVTREAWEPLRGGGYRITSTLVEESGARDGVPVAPAVPLAGVPFTFTIDAAGKFGEVEDVGDTLRAIREHVPSKQLREMLEPLLGPRQLVERLERAWRGRTEGLCNTDLTPGQVFYGIDRQELATGGPAVMLVRARVVGRHGKGLEPAVELALTYGGASSELAKDPAAAPALHGLAEGELVTDEVSGHGVKLVSLDTCQVLSEDATLTGAWKLNRAAIGAADPSSFPERIRFEVRRAYRHLAGDAANAPPPPVTP